MDNTIYRVHGANDFFMVTDSSYDAYAKAKELAAESGQMSIVFFNFMGRHHVRRYFPDGTVQCR